MTRWILMIAIVTLEAACTSSTLFPTIGTHLGNPLMLTVNSATARLYVNNSNNKDLYSQGSIQVYNIATPAAPTLVGTQATLSFSGQLYLDTVNQFLYTPNRYSIGDGFTENQLFQVNVNEASASFLTVTNNSIDDNPFGVAPSPSDPYGRVFAPTLSGTLDSYVIGTGAATMTSYNLSTTANDGTVYTNPVADQLVILGTQAFLPMPGNNILVVNLSKLGSGSNLVDYVITNVNNPRGIATDGTLIYVLVVNASSVPQLLILNPATLTALSGNTQATNVDVATLQQAALTMGNGLSTTDPEQLVVGTTYVFVSNTGDNLVTVVNRVAQTINTNITVGQQPFGLALYSPAGVDTTLYVANTLDNTISVVDAAALTVSATYSGP